MFAQELDKVITVEVRKLLEADFIRKVYYPDWLANVVMVKKANGECVSKANGEGVPKRQIPPPSDRYFGRLDG